jgi:hypothetical protein
MSRFVRSLPFFFFLAVFMALLTPISDAQNVATQHNDTYRTGWQQNESLLTPTAVSAGPFGLLCGTCLE